MTGEQSFHQSIIRSPERLAREISNDVMASDAEIAAAIRAAITQAFEDGYNAARERFENQNKAAR